MNRILQRILIAIVVNIVRIVVFLYTTITLPIYYLVQKPWRRIKLSNNGGANLISSGKFSQFVNKKKDGPPDFLKGAEFIEFERYTPIPHHPLMKCQTVIDAIYFRPEVYPNDQPAIGYREVLEEEVQCDSNGKPIKIDGKVLRKYKLSQYKWINYGQFLTQVEDTCRGLVTLGLKKNDPVAIYSDTGLDFTVSAIGGAKAGALLVTVFHTLTDEGLIYALNETKVKYIFVCFELLDRVHNFIQKCPTLKTVIYFEGPKKINKLDFDPDVKVYTLTQVKEMGRSGPYKDFQSDCLEPDDLFGVMYTSGTTGIPKGVQVTQRQMKEAAMAIGTVVRDVILTGPSHTYIAYLPQAHVLEFSLELFLFLGGVKIGYSSPFTLNESAPGLAKGQVCDLQLLKPTVMPTVPLVLDRMQKEIYAKLKRRTPFSQGIFDFLIDYKGHWLQKGYTTPIVNWLVCGKVQQQFGGRLTYMVVGGAPLASYLQKMIKCSLNVTLIQGYGSTETSGGVFSMDFHDLTFGRVGAPLNNVRVRMINWPDGGYSIRDKPNPRGELIIGGKMVSKGYLNLEELNRESFFDEDGYHWFITGDIGMVHSNGTFSIIDRKKDIVKLANGEFISMGKIEAILKSSIYVDNICIVPNSTLNCLVGLVQPNATLLNNLTKQNQFKNNDEMNGSNIPKGKNKIQMASLPNVDLLQQHMVRQTIYNDIIAVGVRQGLKSIELPSMISLCHDLWTPDNNMLTAAMKLKRANIIKQYSIELEKMWSTLRSDPTKIRVRINRN